MRQWAGLTAALLLVVGIATALPARAEVSETAVKAAFLPRFARYVSWPAAVMPGAGQPFTLCVIGGDPFGRSLDQAAASQTIDGHGIAVRRLPSAAGAEGCSIAFVRGGGGQSTGQLLTALGSRPILTVTDARAGGQRGIIHFAIVDGRVRFFIDEAMAARRGLTISSRLLALAVGVRQR